MTTVTQGSTGTYTFAVNEMATLTLTGSQQARVEVTDGVTGKVKYGAASSVNETFGPFAAGDVLSVTAMRGSVIYTISTYIPPSTGGGGTWGSIVGSLASQSDLNTRFTTAEGNISSNTTAIAGKQSVAINWDGTTPALVSSTSPLAFGSNSFLYTGAGGAVLDGNTFQTGDVAIWNGTVFTKYVFGGGYLGTFASAAALQTAYPAASNPRCTALIGGIRYDSDGTAWGAIEPGTTVGTAGNQTLTSAQNNQVIPTTGASVITVNTGLLPAQGFGCAFVGAGVVTFAGSATVTDKRTTGATNPACSLVPTGTDAYSVIGSKA